MKFVDRIIVYNYKVPFYFREFLFRALLFYKNKFRNNKLKQKLPSSKNKYLSEIKTYGITFLEESSRPKDIQIKQMIEHLNFLDNKYQHNTKESKISYETNDLGTESLFLDLALDNNLISIAGNYFNSLPKIAFLKAWRVNSGADDLAEMSFHMDHHGHRFLKAFWYLNDVNEGCGHHEYIKKTHFQPKLDSAIKDAPIELKQDIKNKRNLKGKHLMNNELVINFFKDDLLKISGKEGTCFIEDTRGLHRGTRMPEGSNRIIYQVLYVPYLSYKDKNSHSKISDLQSVNQFLSKNSDKKEMYKSILSEII